MSYDMMMQAPSKQRGGKWIITRIYGKYGKNAGYQQNRLPNCSAEAAKATSISKRAKQRAENPGTGCVG